MNVSLKPWFVKESLNLRIPYPYHKLRFFFFFSFVRAGSLYTVSAAIWEASILHFHYELGF